ncbi:hypothetical protein O1611_g5725 [Lasiodiplodia mahajangana]|uniref:Uncharacterized protein n=1 Tax=Lasiodiplodia mahajangana TaxID=1108764 RepID=A0ACC2JK78_9PEZI|nr:hypothetical protein O1611_g5725 [Lasiodiplodia mahajangana]
MSEIIRTAAIHSRILAVSHCCRSAFSTGPDPSPGLWPCSEAADDDDDNVVVVDVRAAGLRTTTSSRIGSGAESPFLNRVHTRYDSPLSVKFVHVLPGTEGFFGRDTRDPFAPQLVVEKRQISNEAQP